MWTYTHRQCHSCTHTVCESTFTHIHTVSPKHWQFQHTKNRNRLFRKCTQRYETDMGLWGCIQIASNLLKQTFGHTQIHTLCTVSICGCTYAYTKKDPCIYVNTHSHKDYTHRHTNAWVMRPASQCLVTMFGTPQQNQFSRQGLFFTGHNQQLCLYSWRTTVDP